MDYHNRVVIVTGGGNGIGKTVVQSYANLQANVVIADINEQRGSELANSIKNKGGNALFCLTDVRKATDIVAMIEQTVSTFGRIDILINNAGKSLWKSPYDVSVEEWDDILTTNLRSYFLSAREAAKVMRETGGGKIVNIASTRAFMSEQHSETYAASKGGIISLTHALAASFSPDNIQVNSISPGWIETTNYDQLQPADHKQHFSNRVGRPEDIAKACHYLTSDDNEFINGTNLTIDGGMTKKMIYEE